MLKLISVCYTLKSFLALGCFGHDEIRFCLRFKLTLNDFLKEINKTASLFKRKERSQPNSGMYLATHMNSTFVTIVIKSTDKKPVIPSPFCSCENLPKAVKLILWTESPKPRLAFVLSEIIILLYFDWFVNQLKCLLKDFFPQNTWVAYVLSHWISEDAFNSLLSWVQTLLGFKILGPSLFIWKFSICIVIIFWNLI